MDRLAGAGDDALPIGRQIAGARARLRADDAPAAMLEAQHALERAGAAADAFAGRPDRSEAVLALRRVESEAGTLLARAARRAGLFDRAVPAIRAALRAAQLGADTESECLAHGEYAHILAVLGRNDDALGEAHAALQCATRAGLPHCDAAAYEAFGAVHWMLGQWQDMQTVYQRVLALAEACGHTELCALAHAGLGASEEGLAMIARAAGDEAAAREHWKRETLHATECARGWAELGDLHNIAYAHNMQAVALLGLKDYAAARALVEPHLSSLGTQASARRTLALLNLADIDLAEGEIARAMPRLLEVLAATEQLSMPYYESVCCEMLSRACELGGDLANALKYDRRHHAVHARTASESSHSRALAIAVVLDTERAQAGAEAQRRRAEQLETRNAALSNTAERLARDALEDAMTGIANRRSLDAKLSAEFAPDAPPPACSLALIDVDHFKRVNDRFSHIVGDQVLRRIGALLQRSCRRGDLAARYGGEEFVMVLDALDREAARAVCERVRAGIETEDWAAIDPQLSVTVSIGLAHGGETPAAAGPQALVALADARLYAAKHAGRNRLVDAP